MTLFDYKGITSEENKYAEGSIEAINDDEAAFKLKEKKVIITSLTISKGQKKTSIDKKGFTPRKNFDKLDDTQYVTLKKISHTLTIS